jgi:hypothetical protein
MAFEGDSAIFHLAKWMVLHFFFFFFLFKYIYSFYIGKITPTLFKLLPIISLTLPK